VASVSPDTSPARILVEFGTGRQIPFSLTGATQFANGVQSVYGIWDWNLSAWNSRSASIFASLPAPQSFNASNLQPQTISTAGPATRSITSNKVCWKGMAGCAMGQYGWVVALPGVSAASEQVIYNPILELGTLLVQTIVPAATTPPSCPTGTGMGWTLALSPATGGALTTSFFPSTTTGKNNQALNVSGITSTGAGGSAVVSLNGNYFLVSPTANGQGVAAPVSPPAGTKGSRVTWIQRR
jgi:type IV pilus assembly protein PilY1